MSIHLSASLINDYISCNKKVYYRIQHPELAIPDRYMVIGDIVHHALEGYWDSREKAIEFSFGELYKRIPEDKSALKFTEKCLGTFFDNFIAYVSKDDKIEQRFKIPYEKDIFIVGKMDRISNGSVFDWKTARKPSTDISGDIQFILYDWAYKQIYGKEPSGVYYAALTNGSIIKYKHDNVAKTVLFSEIIPQILDSIRRGDYTANGVFRRSCYGCSYSETCLEELRNRVEIK